MVRETAVNTLKVLSEPVEKSAPRNGIMKSDLRKENAFQQSLVKGGGCMDGPSVEDEPPQSGENHADASNGSIDSDIPHRALRYLVTRLCPSPSRDPTFLSDRSKGGENERAEEDDPIAGTTGSTDVCQPNVLANATDGSLLFFDKLPWDLLVGLGIGNDGRRRSRRARFGRCDGCRLNQFLGIRDLGFVFLLLTSYSTRLDQTIDDSRCIEGLSIALELNTTIVESDDVTGTGSAQLNVMRDKDDGTSLHELSTQTLVEEMVGGMSIDSRQHVIKEQDGGAGIDSSRE